MYQNNVSEPQIWDTKDHQNQRKTKFSFLKVVGVMLVADKVLEGGKQIAAIISTQTAGKVHYCNINMESFSTTLERTFFAKNLLWN